MLPESKDALHVTSRCCGSLTAARPLLLETAAFGTIVACGFDEQIRVYKVADAKPDRRMSSWQWRHWLRLSGHTAAVQDVQACPTSDLRLLSCGLDGRLIVWDYATEKAVQVIEVGGPALRMLALPDPETLSAVCLLAGTQPQAQAELDFRLVRVAAGAEPETIFYKMQRGCLAAGHFGRFVAGASLGHLLLYRVSKKKFLTHYVCEEAAARVTSLAAHPRERTVAVGLSDGRILLLHNVYSHRRLVRQRLQWHFRPVQCLSFASDGCVLFSGGQEAVLVKWDVSPEGGQSRAFLPRLGASLTGLACSASGGSGLVVSLSDNSLLVVDSNLSQIGRVHGIFRGDQEAPFLFGLVRDPGSECVVLNGTAGAVQFYSVSRQRHLGTVDVVKDNYTAVESALTTVRPAQVELLAFSEKGNWMATFDRRDDGRYPPDLTLKLWSRSDSGDGCVDFQQCAEERLSERLRCVSLAFQPNADERKLVCAAEDGTLLCWTREDRVCHLSNAEKSATVPLWQLTRTWRLGHNFTGGPLTFDPSGQLLLTCHQSELCGAVWCTSALAQPPALFFTNGGAVRADADRDVAFCSLWDDGRSVAVCRWDRLCIWDRKSGSVIAQTPLALTSAAEDQKSGMLIVCCADRTLLMVHSGEPAEIIRLRLQCPSPPRHLCVTEDTFVFLTEDHRLFLYPEPADAADASADADTLASGRRDLLPGEVSLLSRVFRREPNYADQLQRRLRLFASADAFAAPNIARFTAENLRLMRRQLLLKSAEPTEEEEEEKVVEKMAAPSLKFLPTDDEEAVPERPALEFERLPDGHYERTLLRCLRRLCLDEDSQPLPSMKELRRERKLQRRRLKSLRSAEAGDAAPSVGDTADAAATAVAAAAAAADADVIFVAAEAPPPRVDVDQPDSQSPSKMSPVANGGLSVDLDEETAPAARRRRRARKRSRSRTGSVD